MPRDFFINGETLVKVKLGDQVIGQVPSIGSGGSNVALELGLTSQPLRISPSFHKKDLRTDDFGPDAAPDVQHTLAHVTINMTLVHYDPDVLSLCVQEGLAVGGEGAVGANPLLDGVLAGAGTPMGKGLPMFASGNNLISLNILSEQGGNPWHFLSCFLDDSPFVLPLGAEHSQVVLTWKAIPYQPLFVPSELPGNIGPPLLVLQQFASSGSNNFQELSSSGVVLWDHVPDD